MGCKFGCKHYAWIPVLKMLKGPYYTDFQRDESLTMLADLLRQINN